MITINAYSADDALLFGLSILQSKGAKRGSRNGQVIVAPEPVTTVYRNPLRRVVFAEWRDANPFFHLSEAIWMLAGRNDVDFPAYFASQIRQYSDDGKTLRGAYGYRWRRDSSPGSDDESEATQSDQLRKIITSLAENPDDRRQVLAMWSAEADLGELGKDVPCNLTATFQVDLDGRLEMTVFQRSGDAIWGVHGANAVHFSILQEYMANAIGREVGVYRHVTANYHAYCSVLEPMMERMGEAERVTTDLYQAGIAKPWPLGVLPRGAASLFDIEAERFCSLSELPHGTANRYHSSFLREVAVPMRDTYRLYKTTEKPRAFFEARARLKAIPEGCDWRIAGEQWIDRRERRWLEST